MGEGLANPLTVIGRDPVKHLLAADDAARYVARIDSREAATGMLQWYRAAQPGVTVPFEVSKQEVTSGEGIPYNAYAHSFAGMGVQFILFMGIEMGVGLLLLRQQGLWQR